VAISMNILGWGERHWEYLVLDINGTLTVDGELLPGVADRLRSLSDRLHIELLTADTRGTAQGIAEMLGVRATRVQPGREAEQKRAHVVALGADNVVALGNGNNDALMLDAAGLSIAVMEGEGVSVAALTAADIAVRHVAEGLDLLLYPTRLLSTLRN